MYRGPTQCNIWQRMTVSMESSELNVEQMMLQNNSGQCNHYTTRRHDNNNNNNSTTTITTTMTKPMLPLMRFILMMIQALKARPRTTTTSSAVTGSKHLHYLAPRVDHHPWDVVRTFIHPFVSGPQSILTLISHYTLHSDFVHQPLHHWLCP